MKNLEKEKLNEETLENIIRLLRPELKGLIDESKNITTFDISFLKDELLAKIESIKNIINTDEYQANRTGWLDEIKEMNNPGNMKHDFKLIK